MIGDWLIWSVAVHLILSSCLCAEADLRIGELQWGDSGVYFCKVVIADDLEGVNEGQLELLVLGAYYLRLISSLKEQHEFVPGVDCWLQFSLFVLLMLVCLHVQLSEASLYWFAKVLEMSFFSCLHAKVSIQQLPWQRPNGAGLSWSWFSMTDTIV